MPSATNEAPITPVTHSPSAPEITTFSTITSKTGKRIAGTAFVEILEHPQEYAYKDLMPLYSGARFTGNSRAAGSCIVAFDAIVVEHDAGKNATNNRLMPIDEARQRLQEAGIAAHLYTTPSHTSEAPRWRVLALLSAPVAPSEHVALVETLNGILDGTLASESRDPKRVWYYGRCTSAAEYRHLRSDGEPLDLAVLFGDLPRTPLPRDGSGKASATPRAPAHRAPREPGDFFGRVNDAAMKSLDAWVPALLPAARPYHDGFRVAQSDLGRPGLEEDLSIVPEGIKDFGTHDMGDSREGRRTPIDLVIEWSHLTMDDLAITHPIEAACWLCEQLEIEPEALGYRGPGAGRNLVTDAGAELEALARARSTILDAADSVRLLGEAADACREILARHPRLLPQVRSALRERYQAIEGRALTTADANARLLPRGVPGQRFALTEVGLVDRLLDRYPDSLMFVAELSCWFAWDGEAWLAQPEEAIRQLTVGIVRDLHREVEQFEDAPSFYRFVSAANTDKTVRGVVSLARADSRVLTPAGALDAEPHVIGVRNGYINLRTGELCPPDQGRRITRRMATSYVPGATAPLWTQTLREVFDGNVETMSFFQRLIGYAAMGEPREDIMVIPWGNGSNGKSTVLGAIRRAFGDYARAAEASSFVSDGRGASNAGGAREDLLRLRGARFVYVNEPDEGGELREGAIKAMTGGDAISARGLYARHSTEIIPTWLVVMPTNHKPIVKGSDNGIWRRLMLIPFTRNFDSDPTVIKDEKREERLLEELEGITAWIIEGALTYQREGLNPPAVVKHARDEYRTQMDLLAEWIEECCEIGSGFSERISALWQSWEEFARGRGSLRYVPSAIALGRRLDSRFPASRGRRGERVRDGIRLKPGFSSF